MKIIIDTTKKEINAAANCAFAMGATSDPTKDIERILSTDMTMKNNCTTVEVKGSSYTMEINEEFMCKVIGKLGPIFGICKNVYLMCKSLFNEIEEEMGETIVINNNAVDEEAAVKE